MTTKSELVINILIHFFILFTILSCIFWILIRKIETKTITNEINKNINKGFTGLKEKIQNTYSQDNKDNIKKCITENESLLNILNNSYSKPDTLTTDSNSWLFKTNILYIFIIASILITMFLTVIFTCQISNFPFFDILKENLVLFTIIGGIEIYFFLNVAIKYIPTLPSSVIENVILDLNNNIK